MSRGHTRQHSGKVVILDRDGTIVVDRSYLADPARLAFEPGAAEGLRLMYEQGCRLVVITNQSGIGRGLFSHQRLFEIHERLWEMVESIGARLEGIYYCPHTPEDQCDCRKPRLALLDRAASELGFDASSVVVIGDKASDIEFGHRAGAATILVNAHALSLGSEAMPDFVASDLVQAAAFIEDC